MISETQQKKTIIIAIGLIVLILGLIFIFAWQKNKLFNTLPVPSKTIQTPPTEITQDTETAKTEKQKIIEQIAPNSDLVEYDVPNEYLKDEYLNRLAVNRNGEIVEINTAEKTITISSILYDKEKEYTITITDQTNITVDVIEFHFYTNDNEEVPSEKNYTRTGDFTDFAVGDIIDVNTIEPIGNDPIIANLIKVKKIETFNH